jgi:hypothetical protein
MGSKNKSSRFHLENLVLFAWEMFIKPHGTPYRFQIGSEFFDESMHQAVF